MAINPQAVAWTAGADQGLKTALGEDLPFIRQEVERGISSLWYIPPGTWMVTRAEGTELVIVALEGRGLEKIMPVLISRAKAQGFTTLRAHTERPGLEKYLKRWGASRREIVLELEL